MPVLGLRPLEPDVVRGAAQRALEPAEKPALLLANLYREHSEEGFGNKCILSHGMEMWLGSNDIMRDCGSS